MQTRFTKSKDGTEIGYRQIGNGPGLVIVHGLMESSMSHSQLAEALAESFTVYLPDRRGRGLSGPHGKEHGLRKEVEDLAAVLMATGAEYVFGISAGALCCLQAALQFDSIQKVAVFDPPLIVNGSVSGDFMARVDRELAGGDTVGALVTAMLGGKMGPPFLQALPRWMLKFLTKLMVSGEEKRAGKDDVTMRMLAPTLHHDFQFSFELEDRQEIYRDIQADLLLLGGSLSPQYFKTALDALAQVLPLAKRIELAGLHHGATGNVNRGGKPDRIAGVLIDFFKKREE